MILCEDKANHLYRYSNSSYQVVSPRLKKYRADREAIAVRDKTDKTAEIKNLVAGGELGGSSLLRNWQSYLLLI